MRKILLLSMCAIVSFVADAQSEDFMQVYEACVFASKAVCGKPGSSTEIARAGELLNNAKWQYLKLFNVDVKGEAKFGKESTVFTPDYLIQLSKDRKSVLRKAEMYAQERAVEMRDQGSKVRLCTKCIGGKKSVTYSIKQIGKSVDVAAVAETNGLINLKVVVKDGKGNVVGSKKDYSDEFKGAASRKVHIENIPKGENVVYITIENKYNRARSVAIIFE